MFLRNRKQDAAIQVQRFLALGRRTPGGIRKTDREYARCTSIMAELYTTFLQKINAIISIYLHKMLLSLFVLQNFRLKIFYQLSCLVLYIFGGYRGSI